MSNNHGDYFADTIRHHTFSPSAKAQINFMANIIIYIIATVVIISMFLVAYFYHPNDR